MTPFLYDFQSDNASITANTQNDNFPVGNVKSKYRTYVYKPTGNTGEYIDIDFASSPSIDAIGLICNITSSGTISLKAYSDAGRTTNTYTKSVTPADTILETFTARTELYWRVELDDATLSEIQVGRLVLGSKFELPNISPQPGANMIDTSIKQRSNSGQSFGVKGVNFQAPSVQWPNNLTNDNRKDLITMFQAVRTYTPFFADLTACKDIYGALYVTFNQDSLNFAYTNADTFTVAIDFTEEL